MATSPTLQDGAEIERRRIEAGLNRPELAALIGRHRTYIRLLENEERSARPKTLKLIADALPDCKVKDLLKKPAGKAVSKASMLRAAREPARGVAPAAA